MKSFYTYLFTLIIVCSSSAQYYIRGAVKDEQGQPLHNVSLMLLSDKLLYHSGTAGDFGINATRLTDTLSVDLDGYQSQLIPIKTSDYQNIIMKTLPSNSINKKPQLISASTDPKKLLKYRWHIDDDSHFSIIENMPVNATTFPNTGFSLNINKETYNDIHRYISTQSTVPPDDVRIEELLNYFNLNYQAPEKDDAFKITSQLSDCPWNPTDQLLYLNINAKKLNLDKVPPCNLVFLIDASASMDLPNRLSLVKGAFQLLVKNLRVIDTVSIVTYGGTVREWLKPTSGTEKQKLLQSIEQIIPDGETPGSDAIKMGYKVAIKSLIKNGNNRIILATDGDFNVGVTSEKALEDLILEQRQTGIILSCLDVGSGDPKDSTLKVLAKKGNGNYYYLDNILTAEQVLMTEMTKDIFTVAKNVSLNVHFNSDVIKEYRLIGFDNKKDAIDDSASILKSEEIGSGNSTMAIFEITPTNNKRASADSFHNMIANVSLTYTLVDSKQQQTLQYNCTNNYTAFNGLSKDFQFATAVVLFGMKLRGSKYIDNADWKTIESIAKFCYEPNNYLQSDFMKLVSDAKKIYSKK
ncbi:MAG TPA: von Willebrand factor type A domain-containing protein [Ferruginibacter sp.]|nr:von Willebrand factor type A domain-containing protein [Ferruginibacter sp.]